MKIGVVSHLFPRKRMPMNGIYVREELDSLAGSVEIRLIAPLPNLQWFGEMRHGMTPSGYMVVRPFVLAFPRWFLQRLYPASMAFSLKLVGSFLKECDCLHVHTAFPDVVAAVSVYGGKIPLVATVHGSDLNYFALKPSLRPGIVAALNRCVRVICVSRSLERTAREIGVTAQTAVIPNGIDISVFVPGGKEDSCIELDLDPSRPRVLYAGNFVPVKGVEYLIRAMPHVLKRCPECELVLVGASPGLAGRTPYDSLIAGIGIGASVRIIERVERAKLPAWIQASDVVAVPSVREGFGLIAAESLACGRPVVATRSGGPEDIVEEGQGMLVPPEDSTAFGDAVLRVLDGEGIHDTDTLVESARKRFSYTSIARRLLEVYEDVCKDRVP